MSAKRMWMQPSISLTIDRESALAGRRLWKLFQRCFMRITKVVALDLTNQEE
jgi:hypothetical protein